MKLNKISDENSSMSWFCDNKVVEVPQSEIDRLSTVNKKNIESEYCHLERCANSNTKYFCSSSVGEDNVKNLREYAAVLKMPMENFVNVDIGNKGDKNIKTASASINDNELLDGLKSAMSDPFKIDEKINSREKVKSDWQNITGQKNLKDEPNIRGGIVAVRAEENYNLNIDSKVAPGQNSILNPDAIGSFMNDKKEDTGVRLARERKEKEEQKIANKEQWQKDIVDSMKDKSLLTKGNVFPTESMVAQSGIKEDSSKFSMFSKFDNNVIADRTVGEKIADNNNERKQSIQRKVDSSDKDSWQKPQGQNGRKISDVFGNELLKYLKKD